MANEQTSNEPLQFPHIDSDRGNQEWSSMEDWIKYSEANNYPTPFQYLKNLKENDHNALHDEDHFSDMERDEIEEWHLFRKYRERDSYKQHPENNGISDRALTLNELTKGPALFYAGCGEDETPALLFAITGAVSTIVYTDYYLDSRALTGVITTALENVSPYWAWLSQDGFHEVESGSVRLFVD